MNKKLVFSVLLVLILALSFVFVGCKTEDDGGGNTGDTGGGKTLPDNLQNTTWKSDTEYYGNYIYLFFETTTLMSVGSVKVGSSKPLTAEEAKAEGQNKINVYQRKIYSAVKNGEIKTLPNLADTGQTTFCTSYNISDNKLTLVGWSSEKQFGNTFTKQ